MSAHYGGINSFLEITDQGVFANNAGAVVRIDESATAPDGLCQGAAAGTD